MQLIYLYCMSLQIDISLVCYHRYLNWTLKKSISQREKAIEENDVWTLFSVDNMRDKKSNKTKRKIFSRYRHWWTISFILQDKTTMSFLSVSFNIVDLIVIVGYWRNEKRETWFVLTRFHTEFKDIFDCWSWLTTSKWTVYSVHVDKN